MIDLGALALEDWLSIGRKTMRDKRGQDLGLDTGLVSRRVEIVETHKPVDAALFGANVGRYCGE